MASQILKRGIQTASANLAGAGGGAAGGHGGKFSFVFDCIISMQTRFVIKIKNCFVRTLEDNSTEGMQFYCTFILLNKIQ